MLSEGSLVCEGVLEGKEKEEETATEEEEEEVEADAGAVDDEERGRFVKVFA